MIQDFLSAAHQNIVNIKFTCVYTGSTKKMRCTLDPRVLKHSLSIPRQAPSSTIIAVWSIDKNCWRSFLGSTLTEWEVET